MANKLVIGFPVFSDVSVLYTPVLSGGSWLAALPLANLQDRELALVARSSDDAAASTQFDCDLIIARAVRVIAVVGHNFTTAATIRVRGSTVANFATAVYDSGTVAAWPSGVTLEDADGMNVGYILAPSADQTARYWRIEVTDTANPDNYVEIGRLAICGGYVPTYHPRVGLQFGCETSSSREETDGGAFLHRERRRRRVLGFEIPELALTEALGTPFKLAHRAGTHGQLVVVRDPDDATQLHKWSFLATQQTIPMLGFPNYHRATWPVRLVEEL